MFEKLNKKGITKYLTIISVGVLLKLFALHYAMGIQDILRVTTKNFLIVMAIMCITCILSTRNRVKAMLVVNLLLSILFFIDAMYYSHFYTLVPAHSVYQIGQLGPVSDSIFALIKPLYFLFFMDSILVFFYLRKDANVSIRSSKKQKKSMLAYLLILAVTITGMNLTLAKDTDGYFTPHNSGVINHHIYDLAGFINKATLNTEHVQALMKNLDEEQEEVIKYFGLAEGRNVFAIQAESLQTFALNRAINGQEITPVLNELIGDESIYFNRYYEQVGWGNTSDSEFISHNGFYPSKRVFSYKAYEDNDFMTLPISLKEKGYSTMAFHGNYGDFWNREAVYPSQGLDTFISLEDLEEDEWINIGISDGSLFNQSFDFIKKMPQPFYSFYVTVTSHHPFTLPEEYKQLDLGGQYFDTVLGNYLNTVSYLDDQIGEFIQRLKNEDFYDNSMIVIYGDHKGLDMRDEEANDLISTFLGKEYKEDEMHRVPFIIHIPGGDVQKELNTVGGQIDFYPTMANLLGVELKSHSTFGKDLLNTEKGFVAMQSHVAQGSFIDDDMVFIMSNDGIFENSKAWDIDTGKSVNVDTARESFERAIAEINLSEYILQNNMIPLVHEQGMKDVFKLEE